VPVRVRPRAPRIVRANLAQVRTRDAVEDLHDRRHNAIVNSRTSLLLQTASTAHRAAVAAASRAFAWCIAVRRHDHGTLACLGSAR
jgi:hypothetical protein